MNSREPRLRRAAMQALGQLRYSAAAQALADQLSYYERGPDGEAALEGMARIGHPASAEIFKRQLAKSNATMRRLAVEGLARAGETDDLAELDRDSTIVAALEAATKDPDAATASAARHAIERIKLG